MARLRLEEISKVFGSIRALDRVSIEVRDGEFLAVLGPSGCGKTTLLRLVAGFDQVTGGTIAIGDRTVSATKIHVPPEERNVGIVFQSYALWPHMNVEENVGYGLRVAGMPAAERRRKVDDALALVGLSGFNRRRPGTLSGGQRQRVALARCLVTAPSLVLLDEPLANLDVHLRASMHEEFAEFHRRTGTTMIYITHDQAEAMALADRIAVMEEGRIQQVATPPELFREPATEMVARFIGQGMVLPGEIKGVGADGVCEVRVLGLDAKARRANGHGAEGPCRLCLRPRDLSLAADGEPGVAAQIRRAVYQGGHYRVEALPQPMPEALLTLDVPEGLAPKEGEAIRIAINDGWVLPQNG